MLQSNTEIAIIKRQFTNNLKTLLNQQPCKTCKQIKYMLQTILQKK